MALSGLEDDASLLRNGRTGRSNLVLPREVSGCGHTTRQGLSLYLDGGA